jgi:hypothetical protein
MILYNYILPFVFITIGLFSIIYPNYISNKSLDKLYTFEDLIRAWGIYSTTIGLLLYYKCRHINVILMFCFIASIIWNLNMISKRYCIHNIKSVSYNLIALLLILINTY